MNDLTVDSLRHALTEAGLEIYRVDGSNVRVAERVRMHLMESGVVVSCDGTPHVALTIRGQRSDFPSASASELHDRVRAAVAQTMQQRGFEESSATTRDINNPVDDSQVLDVWFEITYSRAITDVASAIEDVRWALGISKCIDP